MIVAVEPIENATGGPENNERARVLGDMITTTLQRTKQFQVVDNVRADLTKQERERQKTSDYAGGSTAGQFVVDGAQKLVVGRLTKFASEDRTEQQKLLNGEYKTVNFTVAQMDFTLYLLDVATNANMGTESFIVQEKGANLATAELNLRKKAQRVISNWMVSHLDHDFKIVQVEKRNKKGFPVSVLINGGTNMDLQKGEQLRVVEVQQIGPGTREIDICTITVSEVQGEFSTCSLATVLSKDPEKLHEKIEANTELKLLFVNKAN